MTCRPLQTVAGLRLQAASHPLRLGTLSRFQSAGVLQRDRVLIFEEGPQPKAQALLNQLGGTAEVPLGSTFFPEPKVGLAGPFRVSRLGQELVVRDHPLQPAEKDLVP